MRNINLCLLSVMILFSCSQKKDNAINYEQITITFDTVYVDSKDEIIYLKNSLRTSALSPDKKYLYNYNQSLSAIEIIDLDQLIYLNRTPYEKEGPDGIGNYVSRIELLEDDKLFISSFQMHGIFDSSGRKIKNYNVKNSDLLSEENAKGESFSEGHIFQDDPNNLYGMFSQYDYRTLSFARINFEENQMRNWELDGFNYLKDFFVKQVDDKGKPMGILGPGTFSLSADGKIILSNTAASDLYIYDSTLDSLYFKTYKPKLTADRKKAVFPKTIESDKEFNDLLKALRSEIDFKNLIYDKENKVYYRFSYFHTWHESKMTTDVFLSILDETFSLLAESKMTDLKKAPDMAFVKDGKIWIYENIDDELGFVRLSLN